MNTNIKSQKSSEQNEYKQFKQQLLKSTLYLLAPFSIFSCAKIDSSPMEKTEAKSNSSIYKKSLKPQDNCDFHRLPEENGDPYVIFSATCESCSTEYICNSFRTVRNLNWLKCPMCNDPFYCNKQCQKNDWEEHKSKCQCLVCGQKPNSKIALKRCTKCYSVAYCSKDCQRKHWKDHKKFCDLKDKV